MDLFKIAKKILADYIYDPKHLKTVPSHYHKTKRGWSDNKGVKTKSFYKIISSKRCFRKGVDYYFIKQLRFDLSRWYNFRIALIL